MHRAGTMWGHREDTASTPRREVLGEPALRVPGPQNSSLQGWGRADLCGAIPQAVGLCCAAKLTDTARVTALGCPVAGDWVLQKQLLSQELSGWGRRVTTMQNVTSSCPRRRGRASAEGGSPDTGSGRPVGFSLSAPQPSAHLHSFSCAFSWGHPRRLRGTVPCLHWPPLASAPSLLHTSTAAQRSGCLPTLRAGQSPPSTIV